MQKPLEVVFRHMDHSEALEDRVREEAELLERFSDHIIGCRVVIEAPHQHHHQGKLYQVHIDLRVPEKELFVGKAHHDKHAHEDVYVAVRDAFNAMQRQLEDWAREIRGDVKVHEVPAHGRVTELYPTQDYGTIETPDGREIYFHRNSVLGGDFDQLIKGEEVRFAEEMGEEGPQASTVQLVGKHHL